MDEDICVRPPGASLLLNGRRRERRPRSRLSLACYIVCFAIGAFNHGRDFVAYGPRPYSWAPPLLEAFWSALILLDLIVVILLLLGKRRWGLATATAIMICDVAANSYGLFALGIPEFTVALPLQAAFLGFVLGSIPFLWPKIQSTTTN